jgi:hypothetical protein
MRALTLVIHAIKKEPLECLKTIKNALVAEVGVIVVNWIWMNIFWPIVPWFICDLFFYFLVYVAPTIPFVLSLVAFGMVLGALAFGGALVAGAAAATEGAAAAIKKDD